MAYLSPLDSKITLPYAPRDFQKKSHEGAGGWLSQDKKGLGGGEGEENKVALSVCRPGNKTNELKLQLHCLLVANFN